MVPNEYYSQLALMQARVKKIPNGWSFANVGEVFEIRNNLRKPISEEERKKIPGVYPYYGPTKIQGYIGTYEQNGSYALIGEDGDHFLKYEDHQMTQLVDGKCTINNHAHIIEGTNKATREWFYYYFMHRDIFSFLSRQGAGRYKLNKASLEKIPILIPPLPEQKKIAKILSTWDKAISTTEQLLENAQQQKKALMQQLLTGKKRFPGFSRKWQKTLLGDIASIDSGFAFKSQVFTNELEGIPVIRMSDLKAGKLDLLSVVRVSKETVADLERFSLKPKDFLFGISGSLSSYAWVKQQDIPCYLNQRVGRIRVNSKVDQTFVTYLFLSSKVQQDILDKAAGAAQLNISINDLRSTVIKPPSLQEQQKIAAVLSAADQAIDILKQKLDYLKQEKKALMQQLLTGKRRVKFDSATQRLES